MNTASMEKLPEGIAVPLREAIARCQEQPPTTWGVQALDLVGRKDLRMLIDPGKGRKEGGSKWQSVRTIFDEDEYNLVMLIRLLLGSNTRGNERCP